MSDLVSFQITSQGCYSFAFRMTTSYAGRLFYLVTSEPIEPTPTSIIHQVYPSTLRGGSYDCQPGDHFQVVVEKLSSNQTYYLWSLVSEKGRKMMGPSLTVTTDCYRKRDPKIKIGPVAEVKHLTTRLRGPKIDTNESVAISDQRRGVRLCGPTTDTLDGTGVKVGVFELSYPDYTHQEFVTDEVSRISFGDTNTPPTSFSTLNNHATHVCGIIGASGVEPEAQGIAPKCEMVAFDTVQDLQELMSELNGVTITNHSYGFVLGWDRIALVIDDQLRVYDLWYGDLLSYQESDTDPFGDYSITSQTLDTIYSQQPNLISVWSAGNDRGDQFQNLSGTNQYVTLLPDENEVLSLYLVDATSFPPPELDGGVLGYDSLGPLGVTKNALTIGSVQNFADQVQNEIRHYHLTNSSFSSYGPGESGRVKPDLMAIGEGIYSPVAVSGGDPEPYLSLSGTSMSAPTVTGVLALLTQLYRRRFGGTPSSALLKALLIHTSISAEIGPNYRSGWGLVDAESAAETLDRALFTYGEEDDILTLKSRPRILEDIVFTEDSQSYQFQVEGYPRDVTMTLVWTDPPNLDGEEDGSLTNLLHPVITDGNGQSYLPWVLDPENPNKVATKGINSRDNVQQIQIMFPDPNQTYTLTIESDVPMRRLNEAGDALVLGNQKYQVVLSMSNYTVVSTYEYFTDSYHHVQSSLVDYWETQCLGLKGALSALASYLLQLMQSLEKLIQSGWE